MSRIYAALMVMCASALFMYGCGLKPPPTQQEIAKADYGRYPDTYKEIVTEYVTNRLIDPDSAKFSDWAAPYQAWYRDYRGNTFFGYKVCVFVNAKNRMGGYTGRKLYFVMIHNDRVVAEDGGDYRYGTVGEEEAYKLCR